MCVSHVQAVLLGAQYGHFAGQERQTVFTKPFARCQARLTDERGHF
jgi:hypothetical protein